MPTKTRLASSASIAPIVRRRARNSFSDGAQKTKAPALANEKSSDDESPNIRAPRTSALLRRLLQKNAGKSFTVQQLLDALGASSFGNALMVFSIPELLPIPVPGLAAAVGIPTALISAQMTAGSREIRLPHWILRRSVPRAALTKAIRAVLPVIERAERVVRPRGGSWVTHPLTRRFLGAFLFLLALAIALPIPATNSPPAIAMFVTALGFANRDGLVIGLGVLLGLVSFALLGATGFGAVKLIRRYLIPAW